MASKYFMAGGVDSNWSTDGNWSTTASSGPANTTKAVNGDAAILDAGSPACVIDTASACTSINCTGYTGTLTFNATLTAAGTVTFAAGMTIAGTADLICTTTATLTSGGKTLTGGLQCLGTSQTFTLSGALVVNGLLTLGSGATLSGSAISVGGGLTIAAFSGPGTSVITLTGGTWSGAFRFRNSLTFAGNVTVSGIVYIESATLTYTSGTITTTGSRLVLGNNNATFNTGGMTWNVIDASGVSRTYTLTSLLSANEIWLGAAGCTFAGTGGFTTGVLAAYVTGTANWTLVANVTYTVTEAIVLLAAGDVVATMKSGTPSTKAILTVQAGALQRVENVNVTDIDSSGGQAMYTLGTVTTSTNWTTGTAPPPAATGAVLGAWESGAWR